MRMSLAVKIAVLASSLLIAATLVLFFLVRDRIESTVVRREETRLDRTVALAARELRTEIDHAASDVRVAAHSPSMAGTIEALTHENGDTARTLSATAWEDQLANVFRAMLAANSSYLQVRLVGIADGGREIIRLERTAEGIVRVPKNELQSKGDRPYFKSTLAGKSGVICVSEINLNREHGKIEEPQQPVVRVGTSVDTAQRKPFGIIVINIDLTPLLKQVASFSIDPVDLYLTTETGDYLSAPDSRKTFGIRLGPALPYPGGDALACRYVSWRCLHQRAYRHGDMIAHTLVLRAGENTQKSWAFVGTIDIKRAMADFLSFRYWLMGTVISLIVIGGVGAIFFARRMTAPLRQLTAAVKGVGNGNFHEAVAKTTAAGREIVDLRSAFETMREAIQTREQRLRDAHARIEAVVENAVSPIITINDRGRIIHVNEATCKAFGYAAAEMEGQNVSMLMPPPDREEHDGYINNYLATGDAKVIGTEREVIAMRKDGSTFPIDLGVAESDWRLDPHLSAL